MITATEQYQINGLRTAYNGGCRIQAWHLTGPYPEGKWETVSADGEPEFSCPPHLYRIHPDDHMLALNIAMAKLDELDESF